MIRFLFHVLLTVLLATLTAVAGWLWYTSPVMSHQVLVRGGGPRAWLVTVDRGRAAVLIARGPALPMEARRFGPAPGTGDLLDQRCKDHLVGFGHDGLVRSHGLAPIEATAMLTGSESILWRARRAVVPMWAVVAAAAGLLLVWLLRFDLPLLREYRGRCRRCGNDVRSSSHFCPSCQHPLPRRSWSREGRGEV